MMSLSVMLLTTELAAARVRWIEMIEEIRIGNAIELHQITNYMSLSANIRYASIGKATYSISYLLF